MTHRCRTLTSFALAASFGLGACSDSSGPTDTPLSARNADAVGAAAVSTADLALAVLNPSLPAFGGGFPLFFATGRSLAGGLAFSPRPGPDGPTSCPVVSDTTDTDHDGVPDNAVFSFTTANCTQTDIEGNRSVVTGTVAVADPGLTAGYDLHLDDLTAAYYQNGAVSPFAQLIMEGDWALRGTSDALSLDQQYAFSLSVQGEHATLTNDLAVSFTAASGTAIAWGVPLPDGTISINGAWQVATAEENHALTLTTLEPLVYDDACGGFVGGVLDAQGLGGNVRVTWTACGLHQAAYLPAN
jgi:hypothetical protein